MDEKDDILNELNPGLTGPPTPLTEEQLMAYLAGKLPAALQHAVEHWLAEDGMESDAIEGLKTIDPEETSHIVNRLNTHVKSNLKGKRKRNKTAKNDPATIVAVIIILLLSLTAYLVLKLVK